MFIILVLLATQYAVVATRRYYNFVYPIIFNITL
jgi:hypothetical protein